MRLDDLSGEVRNTTTTRKRALPFTGSVGIMESWSDQTTPPPSYTKTVTKNSWAPSNLQGTQVTTSENHPGWKRRRYGDITDQGGNFRSEKTYVRNLKVSTGTFSWASVRDGYGQHGYTYRGPILPHSMSGVTFPPSAASSDAVLNAVGAEAVADVKPTNNVGELTTALVELYREGLPRIIGSSFWKKGTADIVDGSLFTHSAEELLNLEFGIKPLVADIRDFAHGMLNAQKLIKQFERDAGKLVRRRRSFALIKDETDTQVFSNLTSPYTTSSGLEMYYDWSYLGGKVRRRRTTTKRRWFAGAFTYHLGIDPYTANRLDVLSEQADHLLGIELTPSTLYNLAPWSWAVDWVSSLGDVISNLEDHIKYGLVMPYGYMMEHSIVSDMYYWVGGTNLKFGPTYPYPITLVNETKIRRKANPFGFGLTWDALDARQQSILTALGITRRGH